ncbi:MAG: glycosyltransferase family 2 protein [Verrucomicrobia bacterium]|nr:glycosyltransferase family 2 protein [Verrucomicrobiota bacterium]
MYKTKPQLADLPSAPSGLSGWPWTEGSPELADSRRDGSDWPAISIVVPCYMHAEFVEKTLRSILLQAYPALQVLVMDGGSNDGSVEVIEKYAAWLDVFVSEPDRGQSDALMKGFSHATGEIMNWLCSDDWLLPGALGIVAELQATQADAVAWVGKCLEIDIEDNALKVNVPRLPKFMDRMGDWGGDTQFWQPSCFFRRDAFEKVGGLRESLHFVMDVDLWIRLAKIGRFAQLDEVVSAGRMHADAKTSRDVSMRESEILAANIISGTPDIARERFNRYLDLAAGREVIKRKSHNPIALFRFKTVADGVPYRMLAGYFWTRTLTSIKRKLLPGSQHGGDDV